MNKNKKLSLAMLTTLVAGNMIGSGIFLLPANLANIGSISLFSWGFTALGAFLLAIVFSRMSLLVPKTGGPYAYAQAGFGNFIGFQTAYNYWIAIWVGNAAIVIAMVGYLAVFWPILHQPLPGCICAIITIWFLTMININGVRSAGLMQIVTTILKFLPILSIAIFGWWHFHPEFLVKSFNVSHESNFAAISNGATLTLWAFIGLESATVPSGSVDNPERNIPLATLLGTLIAAIVYIVSSSVIMGMIPVHVLALSTSPFAAAAGIIFGPWGRWLIAAGAVISAFGCLNGWILLQGQVAMAAADDGLFPKLFAYRNKAGVPALGLIITSSLITIFLLLSKSPNLVKQYQTIILVGALTSLIPYLYTAIAEIILLKHSNEINRTKKLHIIIAILAGLYAYWALFGSGEKIIFYGSILVFTSVPLYALVHRQKKQVK
ncbi:MAG: amino acid permease [Gammaproteobacteria bacterium]|nr:amino acid permease [Gammaproteobacteria bacterium]